MSPTILKVLARIRNLRKNANASDVVRAIERSGICRLVSYARIDATKHPTFNAGLVALVLPVPQALAEFSEGRAIRIDDERTPFELELEKADDYFTHFPMVVSYAHLGVFIRKDEVMPRHTLDRGLLLFEFARRKEIIYIFNVKTRRFKIELKSFNGPFQIGPEVNSNQPLLLSTSHPPRVFLLEQTNPFEYDITKNWVRVVNPFVGDLAFSLTRATLDKVRSPTLASVIGRCPVHRYYINKQASRGLYAPDLFAETLKELVAHGLVQSGVVTETRMLEQNSNPPFPIENMMALPFNVLFQLLSLISQHTVSECTIDQDAIDLLAGMEPDFAETLLEMIKRPRRTVYNLAAVIRRFMEDENEVHREKLRFSNLGINHRLIRKAIVTPTKIYLCGPHVETTNRIIRTYKDDSDNFLRVTFSDEDFQPLGHDDVMLRDVYFRIEKMLDLGVDIGGNVFSFLHYSNSQMRSQGCWFFKSTESVDADRVRQRMGDFTMIKNPAKFGARMAQCFSSSTVTGRVDDPNIVNVEDIVRNGYIFSDGVGRLGTVIADNIYRNLRAFKYVSEQRPSAYQFRMAGYKGVLTVDPEINPYQIHLRPSQNKFDSRHWAIEVCRPSFFSPGFLNRQFITILESLGVPAETFIEIKDEMLQSLEAMLTDPEVAIGHLRRNRDEHGISDMICAMIENGFWNDVFVVNLLRLFYAIQMRDLKSKTKLFVPKSCHLLGVMDESAELPPDHIFVQYLDPTDKRIKNVTGKVVVSRSPSLHPGDMRVVTAASVRDFPRLAHLVDVVVFSQLGDRPLPNMLGGGDLDGDTFFVTWDQRLLFKKNYPAMAYDSPQPIIKENITVDDIKEHLVDNLRHNNLGQIDNTWLAVCDQEEEGALSKKALALSELHSMAVDFPKTGRPARLDQFLMVNRYPDFMEKSNRKEYKSKRAIGEIYRSILLESCAGLLPYPSEPRSELILEGYELFVEEAMRLSKAYATDIYSLMKHYSIQSEYELISGYMIKVTDPTLKKKRFEVSEQIMDTLYNLRQHYRRLFFKTTTTDGIVEQSNYRANVFYPPFTSFPPALLRKASAWYLVIFSRRKSTEIEPEKWDDTKRLREERLSDKSEPNLPAFSVSSYPEIPVSFGFIMYDVLCSILYRANEPLN